MLALLAFASPAHAQSTTAAAAAPPPSITFTPGMRLQPRFSYDQTTANNDFFIARTRLKVSGKVYDLGGYGAEIKLDNTGRLGTTSTAQVENAWMDFPIVTSRMNLRVGFYDAPFSRNALTSDSKLLVMDRSMIKDALSSLGIADNTIGLLGHGRPHGGRFEYAAGFFDNIAFDASTRQSDGIMSMGRVMLHFLDPSTHGGYGDYRGSHIGQGRRFSVGTNGAFLPKVHDGATEFDLTAVGADVLFNTGPFVIEGEYDRFEEKMDLQSTPDITGNGWYVQSGYLVRPRFELAARYQELDPNDNVATDRQRWTTAGVNVYIREHNLKVQSDYTFKREGGIEIDNDLFQMQLQLDY